MLKHSARFAFVGLLLEFACLPLFADEPASTEAGTAKPSAVESLMIWDGGTAAKGKGWVSPESDANKIAASETVHKGKKSLEFKGAGSGWIGCGWNWHSWWPASAKTDISGYKNMRFYIKVTGDAKPGNFTFSLVTNVEGTPESKALTLKQYAADKETASFNDGEWHEIVIPVKDFVVNPKKPGFDPKKVWEFRLSEWANANRDFTVNLDSIRFEKAPGQAQQAPEAAAPEAASPEATVPEDKPAAAPLMIWDGGTAAKGKGWVSPESDANKIAASETVHKGKKSLEFKGAGSGWIGCGWNWHSWWPASAKTDISGYKNMRFYIKVTGDAKPDDFTFSLVTNVEGTPESKALTLKQYAADKETASFNDGEWHEIVIPVKDFVVNPKKPGFDPKKVWEFRLSEWANANRDFTVNLDSIRLE